MVLSSTSSSIANSLSSNFSLDPDMKRFTAKLKELTEEGESALSSQSPIASIPLNGTETNHHTLELNTDPYPPAIDRAIDIVKQAEIDKDFLAIEIENIKLDFSTLITEFRYLRIAKRSERQANFHTQRNALSISRPSSVCSTRSESANARIYTIPIQQDSRSNCSRSVDSQFSSPSLIEEPIIEQIQDELLTLDNTFRRLEADAIQNDKSVENLLASLNRLQALRLELLDLIERQKKTSAAFHAFA